MLENLKFVFWVVLALMSGFIWLGRYMQNRDALHEEISVSLVGDRVLISVFSVEPVFFIAAYLKGFRPRLVILRRSCKYLSSFNIPVSRLTSERNPRISFLVRSKKMLSLITVPISTINRAK